jgi:hypothetical protein
MTFGTDTRSDIFLTQLQDRKLSDYRCMESDPVLALTAGIGDNGA